MNNKNKFNIGDLVMYKQEQPADYLFGKSYGIITEIVNPNAELVEAHAFRHKYYYKIHWGVNKVPTVVNFFSPDQLKLIARAEGT